MNRFIAVVLNRILTGKEQIHDFCRVKSFSIGDMFR